MGWILILLASLFEILGSVGLTLFSKRGSISRLILYIGGFLFSFVFLYFSFNYLELSIAYPVWVGLGTSGAVLANMFLFNESKNGQRLVGLALIVVGVVGLKIVA
ncbi:SMR family transporter [Orbaceae bacterium ESL0721]|nr:SMR family transporter [Orbaceae bacterium ESL0721]